MNWFLAGAVSAAMSVAARPPGPDMPQVARHYASAGAAVIAALAERPAVVVAFGEFHQTNATAGIPSALRRFTVGVLPAVAPRFSHLVVETWVATGGCGEAERIVTDDVPKTTRRPAATSGEIETLIRSAARAGVVPRILSITCADYQAMRGVDKTVDYDRTLRLTGRALEVAALGALREWSNRPTVSAAAAAVPVAVTTMGASGIAIYGGALHNELDAQPELAPYSFAPRLMAATLGRYVEIDLVVARYAATSPSLRALPWWPVYRRYLTSASWRAGKAGDRASASDGGAAVVMVRRSPRSFVIIFPS